MTDDWRIPEDSPVYQEVARLHRIAYEIRPGQVSRWNGELYGFSGQNYGGVNMKTGAMRLNQEKVLEHLTGSTAAADRELQVQALLTVLHESYHTRNEPTAPLEPNAVHARPTIGFDEGLTERAALNDFPVFARRAGYHGLTAGAGTHEAAVTGLHNKEPSVGSMVAHDTRVELNAATNRIRQHYTQNPATPYPARVPNAGVRQQVSAGEQQRAAPMQAQRHGPVHAPRPSQAPPESRPGSLRAVTPPRQPVGATAGASYPNREFYMAFSGSQPAAQATSSRPSTGMGERGSGAHQQQGVSQERPGRPDRDR